MSLIKIHYFSHSFPQKKKKKRITWQKKKKKKPPYYICYSPSNFEESVMVKISGFKYVRSLKKVLQIIQFYHSFLLTVSSVTLFLPTSFSNHCSKSKLLFEGQLD